jgi:hypothetical protein
MDLHALKPDNAIGSATQRNNRKKRGAVVMANALLLGQTPILVRDILERCYPRAPGLRAASFAATHGAELRSFVAGRIYGRRTCSIGSKERNSYVKSMADDVI